MTEPRSYRGTVLGITIVVAVLGSVAGAIGWLFDPAALKPELVGQVRRLTGRTLTVAGKIGFKVSLTPTITLEDVSLDNPPGFSRPEFVKAARLELRVALAPLWDRRVEIENIAVVRPDILLETDSSGRGNWVTTPSRVTNTTQPGALREANTAKEPLVILVREVVLTEGHVAWIDHVSGQHLTAGVPRLVLSQTEPGAGRMTGQVIYESRSIEVTGQNEPLASHRIGTKVTTWPMTLNLAADGMSLRAKGHVVWPLSSQGFDLTVDGTVPDSAALAPFWPGRPPLPMKDVTLHAGLSDGGILGISDLAVGVGSADLDQIAHGARLENMTIAAHGTDPIRVAARVVAAGVDSGITGGIGDLPWLAAGARGPLGVDLALNAATSRATVKGRIEAPARMAGYKLDVTADLPDPHLLTDNAPPGLKSVTFRATLTDTPGATPFRLTSSAGDLTGEVAVAMGTRPIVTGWVSSGGLDIDAFRRVPVLRGDSSAVAGLVSPPDKAARLLPDTKLPFARLRAVDTSFRFHFDHVTSGGANISTIDGAITLDDGLLRLDPLTAAAPDLHLSARLEADAGQIPPRVHLVVNAPQTGLAPLLIWLGLPQAVTGAVDIRADLIGQGETPAALAGTLGGWAGLAVQNGRIDAAMVNAWLDSLRPLRIDGTGATDLRCFAARAEAKAGIATLQPLALSTAPLLVEGSGEIDLGRETMSLRLRPRTKVGGTGVAVPMRVTGPWRAPSARIDISATGMGSGLLSGLIIGGKDVMAGADPCPDALAHARADGPMLAVPPPRTPASLTPPVPIDVLGWLLSGPEGKK